VSATNSMSRVYRPEQVEGTMSYRRSTRATPITLAATFFEGKHAVHVGEGYRTSKQFERFVEIGIVHPARLSLPRRRRCCMCGRPLGCKGSAA